MKRRAFITLLGAMAAAPWLGARAVRAQNMPVIGFLGASTESSSTYRVRAFLDALKQSGFVDGENVKIVYRWGEDRNERLPGLVAELLQSRVALIVTAGGGATALAAKAATATIPIVFQNGSDPVQLGLVASLGRPGGNLTGVTTVTVELAPKRLEFVRELVPGTSAIGWMSASQNPNSSGNIVRMDEAGRALGRRIVHVGVTRAAEVDAAFASLVRQGAGALVVGADPFFSSLRDRLVELAAHHRIPTMYAAREYVDAGGLMSYGADIVEASRQVGLYAGRILKGEKPADLPVLQPTKLELIVNLKTAKTLGLEVPLSLLMRIDGVIE